MSENESSQPRTARKLRWILPLLCIAMSLAILYSFRIVVTSGPSMEPTYHSRDILLCIRSFRNPAPGDAVLIQRDGVLYVKRVAYTAGQTVDAALLTDDAATSEGVYWDGGIVPDGYLFVLGDNTDNSLDSRNPRFGLTEASEVWGYIIFSFGNLNSNTDK